MSNFKTLFKENYKGHKIEVKQSPTLGSCVIHPLVAYVEVKESDGEVYQLTKKCNYTHLTYVYFPLDFNGFNDVIEEPTPSGLRLQLIFDNDTFFEYGSKPFTLEKMCELARSSVDRIEKEKQKEEQARIKARKEFDEALREGYLPFSTDF